MRDIAIGGKKYEAYWVAGKVAAANRQLETRVHGGGSGGNSAPAPVTSTTVTHDEIFLIDNDGKEHSLRLQNWNVSSREGHEMLAIWLIKKGKSTGPYVVIHNRTLNETYYNDAVLTKMHRPLWLYPFVPLAGFFVLPEISGWSSSARALATGGIEVSAGGKLSRRAASCLPSLPPETLRDQGSVNPSPLPNGRFARRGDHTGCPWRSSRGS